MATIAIGSTKPLLCRLNLHHRWVGQYNPAGEAYRRCRLCGKDDPGNQGPPPYYITF